ncbi:MAG: hypothetical protein Sv326_0769 [Candidatus Fermentimicrarchaeum limneticum]|uniref:Uncharacterized protein n=1 Tax=Fermentimicrarchaeum limneticum TaxID=2795018 RepID=A0A7D6BV21_FERL1|nr:MAG: hypothetical protein Sv326_0769 [Candidatus Fermentimicrarchaeum limneticum]
MERDTLIKVFALVAIIFFIIEMFNLRPAVTSGPSTSSENTSNTTPLYASGNTTATLTSYSDYINVFKSGEDISANSSLDELKDIAGVGYINRVGGTVTLVLDYGANVSLVAEKIKEKFPDLNVTANALLSLPPEVELTTAAGKKNISINALIRIEVDPWLDIGDNVTLSVASLVVGNKIQGSLIARIVPTENEVVANATISGVGDNYTATVVLPWDMREVNTSKINEELSAQLSNVSINYAPDSFVAVKGLDSKSNETIEKIQNLSYVEEVSGDIIYVKEDFNDSARIEGDLREILGENATVDYTVSKISISFYSSNFSKDALLSVTGGQALIYRQTSLKLGEKITIDGRDYNLPSSTAPETMLLDSFAVGQNVSVQLKTERIGKRILNVELERVLGYA